MVFPVPSMILYLMSSVTLIAFFMGRLLYGGRDYSRDINVAFIGNSMQYYNDIPRVMETISGGHIHQNSCLRGGSTISSLLRQGNGMGYKWKTENALQEDGTYDTGASTVHGLLLGDEDYGLPATKWDYVIINDRTYNPAYEKTLRNGMKTLAKKYVPWLRKIGATPIFLSTYAYLNATIHTSSFGDVENYTHILRHGYYEYKYLMDYSLPEGQQARVAQVGKAFLKVYEDSPDMWVKLFHYDGLHPSPHGSYLMACVIYCTIFKYPPPKDWALPRDPSTIFDRSRRMQPPDLPPLDRPTLAEASYLYDVAMKVALSNVRVRTKLGWE